MVARNLWSNAPRGLSTLLVWLKCNCFCWLLLYSNNLHFKTVLNTKVRIFQLYSVLQLISVQCEILHPNMSYDSKFYFVRVELLNTEFYSKRLSIIRWTLYLGNRDVSGKQRKWTQSDPGTNITKYEKRNVCSQISQENFPQQPVSRCKDPMRFPGCLQPTFAKSSLSSWQSHISIKNSQELSGKDWSAQQVFASWWHLQCNAVWYSWIYITNPYLNVLYPKE